MGRLISTTQLSTSTYSHFFKFHQVFHSVVKNAYHAKPQALLSNWNVSGNHIPNNQLLLSAIFLLGVCWHCSARWQGPQYEQHGSCAWKASSFNNIRTKYRKIPFQDYLNISLVVYISLFEVTSGSLAVKDALWVLQHPKFNVSLFKAQVESLTIVQTLQKALQGGIWWTLKENDWKKLQFRSQGNL